MKKILSTLVMVLFGVGSMWAATSTYTLTAKATTAFTPAATGITTYTTVCSAFGAEDCTTSYTFPQQTVTKENHKISGISEIASLLIGKHAFTTTMYLSTYVESVDYVFSHWTDNSGNTIEDLGKEGDYAYLKEYNYTDIFSVSAGYSGGLIAKYTAKNKTETITLTAHWVQPQVTGADKETLDLGTIIDPNGSATGQVTFSLNNDVSFHDYTVVVSEGFEATLDTYEERSGKVVLNVSRTASGVHGTYAGTVTLRSNYPQNNGTCKTVNIKVAEDYTPQFSMPATYDFGMVYTGAKKGSDEALYAFDKNPAAAMPAPVAPAINGTAWSADITGADASVFEVMNSQDGNVVVRFSPTEERTYEADLALTVVYTDADGGTPLLQSTVHTTLTGNGKVPVISAITFDPESLDFAEVVTNQTATAKVDVIEQNVSDITYDFNGTNPNGIFTYTATDGLLTVTALSTNILGVHTATLTATGNDTRAGESGITTGSIEMTVHVKMQSPVLKGGTNLMDTYYLSWEKVPCATVYEIYQVVDGTQTKVDNYITLVDNETTMKVGIESSNAQNTYVVKAINDSPSEVGMNYLELVGLDDMENPFYEKLLAKFLSLYSQHITTDKNRVYLKQALLVVYAIGSTIALG